MQIATCARCHTVLLSGGCDTAYCPNCDYEIPSRDCEKAEFTAIALYAITLTPEYAAELGIPIMITDDFQATNLMRLGVAIEKVSIPDEITLAQMMTAIEQQRSGKNNRRHNDYFKSYMINLITSIKERKILMLHKPKPMYHETSTPLSVPQSVLANSIPAFFIQRIASWFAFATLIATASVVIGFVSETVDGSLWLGLILAALLAYKGADLLHIARKRKYFVLELKCVEITERSLKDMRNIWDPTSQTAFRKTTTISFADASDTRLHFIFDAGRRFVVGSSYNFYFRCPQNAEEPLTVEMLEQLKIDHEPKEVLLTGITSAVVDPTPITSAKEQQA